jgi:hypothetical protein
VRRIYQVLFDLPELSASVSPDAPTSRASGALSEPKSSGRRASGVVQSLKPLKKNPSPEK